MPHRKKKKTRYCTDAYVCTETYAAYFDGAGCVCVNAEAGSFLISAGRLRCSRGGAASKVALKPQVTCSALFYQRQRTNKQKKSNKEFFFLIDCNEVLGIHGAKSSRGYRQCTAKQQRFSQPAASGAGALSAELSGHLRSEATPSFVLKRINLASWKHKSCSRTASRGISDPYFFHDRTLLLQYLTLN